MMRLPVRGRDDEEVATKSEDKSGENESEPRWTRTIDPILKRDMLYQLSYRPTLNARRRFTVIACRKQAKSLCYTENMFDHKRLLLGVLSLALAVGCTRKETIPAPNMELSLYSGIRQVVNINETEEKALERGTYKPERVDLSAEPGVDRVKFSHLLFYKEVGVRAYFRNGRVALIEVQDPFQGNVQGHRLPIFKLTNADPDHWDRMLIAELGVPNARMGGGNFGSEALYYSWGDISFNAKGPNEIAVYRDPEIAKYRQTSFGRKIKIF
jgi:hypothetical protein